MQRSSYGPEQGSSEPDGLRPNNTAGDGLDERMLLGLALLLAAGMWLYSQWVMVPAERAHHAEMGQPADVGDLYPRWYGTRELLLHQRDPYGVEVSREIQVAYYGHGLDTDGADRGRDEQRFAYPVYVVFFLAPTVEWSFSEARSAVRWALALCAAASVLLWLRALQWRPSWMATLALVSLTLSSPPMVQALRLQQLAVLVAFFLAGSAALILRGSLFRAGCLLACATIKPQLALLPVLWLLMWVTGDWKRRQGLALGFGGTLALLMAAGQVILPGWLGKFVQGLVAYRHYVMVSSWLDPLLTPGVAKPISAVLLGVLLVYCVRWRSEETDPPTFVGRLAVVLVATVVILPLLPPFNHVLLLPGVLLMVRYGNRLWERGRAAQVMIRLGVAVAGSSWIAAGVLAAVHRMVPSQSLNRIWDLPFLLAFGLPPIVAAFLMVLLKDLGAREAA
jgi:hypothetical protein